MGSSQSHDGPGIVFAISGCESEAVGEGDGPAELVVVVVLARLGM